MDIDDMVEQIHKYFRTFGGDKPIDNNPVAAAMKGKGPVFALGVKVRDVVGFIFMQLESEKQDDS